MSDLEDYISTFHEPWMAQGNCTGIPEVFYPERSNSRVQYAKNICKGTDEVAPCPVRDQCLEYALEHNEKFGVWGGTSERERRKLQRQRRTGKALPVTAAAHAHRMAPPEVLVEIVRKGRRIDACQEEEAELRSQQAG